MKKIIITFIAFFLLNSNSFAEEKIDCKSLKKISQKIACKTKSIGKGIGSGISKVGSGIKKTGSNLVPKKLKNKERKKITIIPKSFSEKKTLADFFKTKEK